MVEQSAKFKTLRHIETVRNYLDQCAIELIKSGQKHDQCKLQSPEADIFEEFTPKLRGCTYGSEEYKSFLKEMSKALDHHYENSKHHPEWEDYNIVKWKDVKGYEGIYQVSNFGDVRNKNKILKAHTTPKGYLRIQLVKEKEYKNFLIHRLVAEHFLDTIEGKNQVNHIDTNKINNYYMNLEWVNNGENQLHAYNTGLQIIKYIVYCEELKITTFGCGSMERVLLDRGYKDARESTILACINGTSSHHMGLHFEGYNIEEYERSKLSNMTLFDLLEMLCDWKAATLRHNDGNIFDSLKINKKRFNIADDTYQILLNTVKLMECMKIKNHAEES
jgi:hypothetical protein